MANNYVLGRGKLYFSLFKTGTRIPMGERYFGNTPEFNATISTENLDHYSSDSGIRVKDESVPLQTDRTATFITDNISLENIALFFFGSTSGITSTAGNVTGEDIEGVEQGLYYQIGRTDLNPTGVRNITTVVVKDGTGATTYDENDDYTVDLALGRLYIVPGGAITDASDIAVDYATTANSRSQVISGSKPIEGALHYVADNPVGENFDWYMPYVKLAPNGDYALKGDDWQQIPFTVEMLESSPKAALYIDGRAST